MRQASIICAMVVLYAWVVFFIMAWTPDAVTCKATLYSSNCEMEWWFMPWLLTVLIGNGVGATYLGLWIERKLKWYYRN